MVSQTPNYSTKGPTQPPILDPPDSSKVYVNDVMKIAKAVGLTLHRPISELEERIENILASQESNWRANY